MKIKRILNIKRFSKNKHNQEHLYPFPTLKVGLCEEENKENKNRITPLMCLREEVGVGWMFE